MVHLYPQLKLINCAKYITTKQSKGIRKTLGYYWHLAHACVHLGYLVSQLAKAVRVVEHD